MIPYVICFLPSAVICLFSKNKYPQNKMFIFLMLLPLFLLTAFRGSEVGADTLAYNRMYETMRDDTFVLESSYDRLEVGYKVFLWCLTRISANPQFQYIVLSIFYIVIFTFFLYRNTDNPARFVVLFLGLSIYTFYLTGIRQSIAMTICLLAYEKAKQRKLIMFVLIVMIAFSFHKSALFFGAAYFFTKSQKGKIYIPIYISIFILAIIFNEQIFAYGSTVFDIDYGIETTGNGYFMFGIVAITTLLSFIFMEELEENRLDNIMLIQLNVISMALWILRLFSRTAERVALIYMPFTILLIVELFDLSIITKDDRLSKLINLSTTVFLGLYFFYRLDGTGLLPYIPFWR